ncbi:DUF485 domain-containing protein [Streptomyces sp. CA-135486]|uniref:DUF485 domain-containing protein n=1 Tax=Streptomyces sp. CA-135486 TaxID=3240049 RepID=UPI003D8A3739
MSPSVPPPPPWDPGTPREPVSLWEPGTPREPALSVFEQLQTDEGLQRLRAARRRPVFAVAGAVVALYLLNALLAGEARGFMAVRVAGPLNIGLILSLIQCLTTVLAVRWYTRHARTVLDPDGRRLRARFEKRENAR